jgi:hypothetical protein
MDNLLPRADGSLIERGLDDGAGDNPVLPCRAGVSRQTTSTEEFYSSPDEPGQ